MTVVAMTALAEGSSPPATEARGAPREQRCAALRDDGTTLIAEASYVSPKLSSCLREVKEAAKKALCQGEVRRATFLLRGSEAGRPYRAVVACATGPAASGKAQLPVACLKDCSDEQGRCHQACDKSDKACNQKCLDSVRGCNAACH